VGVNALVALSWPCRQSQTRLLDAVASDGYFLRTRVDWLATTCQRPSRFTNTSVNRYAPLVSFPLAVDDFGRDEVDDVTSACFAEAMSGELEAVGFRTEPGFDGLGVRGRLWGGNLTMVCSLLGTPHMPRVKGGVLFLEDVNEHPYRVERHLLHLLQAGVIDAQKAVVLGAFSAYTPSPLDRGYTLKSAVQALRSRTRTPVLTGLPYGHVPTHVTLPIGLRAQLLVQGRDVLIGW